MVSTRLRRLLTSEPVETILKLGVVLSVVVSLYAAWSGHNLAACVAAYNDANNRRSVIITQVNEQERLAERRADDAQAALFLSPALTKPAEQVTAADRAETLRLLRAYQTALSDQAKERAEADDARRVHPIPNPPSEYCG